MMKERLSQSACPILAIASLAGCLGYRTPMLDPNAAGPAATPPAKDAGADLPWKDASRDILGKDTGIDLPRKDVGADLPGKDLSADLPRSDVRVDGAPDLARADLVPDLVRADTSPLANCKPGDPYVLTLGADNNLYHFDTDTLVLGLLASVGCGNNNNLNSLTASTIGPAYISNQSGELCVVDLTTFTSSLTAFDPSVISGDPSAPSPKAFGMALLPDSVPAEQTLYIAAKDPVYRNRLSRIDLTTYKLTDVGPIQPTVPWAELTAGPDGELYGFERLPSLTLKTAQQIADTAQRFGQDDDITVLALSLAPAIKTDTSVAAK